MRNVLLQNFPQNTSNNSHHAEWKICRVKRTKYQDAAPDTGKQFDIRRNCICRKAEQVGKNEATVSRWCSNKMQPSLDMLVKIASLLNVDPRQLINGGNNK